MLPASPIMAPPLRAALLLAASLAIGIMLALLLGLTPSSRIEPGLAKETLLISALVIVAATTSMHWHLPAKVIALLALMASASWLVDGPVPSRCAGAGSRVVTAASPDGWREHVRLSRTPIAGTAHLALRAHHTHPQTVVARALLLVWLTAALAPERVLRRWGGAVEAIAFAGFLGLLAIAALHQIGGTWRQFGYDATPMAAIADGVLLALSFAVLLLAIVSREDLGPIPRHASAVCAVLALGVDALSSELALRELSGAPFALSDATREVARTPRLAWTVVGALLWVDLLADMAADGAGGDNLVLQSGGPASGDGVGSS